MRLITITGPAGAGKDTVARMMSEMTGWPVLCSYTTRPMRDGEKNGREHWFVDRCDLPKCELLAYTVYGGHEYWTTIDQMRDPSIYIVDEVGLKEIRDRHPEISVYAIYIDRSPILRLAGGVKLSRMLRDVERMSAAPCVEYDYSIENPDNMSCLRLLVAKTILDMPMFAQYKLCKKNLE